MDTGNTIKQLAEKYSMTPEQFIRYGSINILKEKKRNLQIERLEILAGYKCVFRPISDSHFVFIRTPISKHSGH